MVGIRYHLPMPPPAPPTAPPRPPSLAGYASYLTAQVAKAAGRVLADALAPHDLRLPHFAVLAALHDLGAACQQDLCDALDLDKSHMVGFVDDLLERELVSRQRDEADRRRWRVTITDAGERALDDLHAAETRARDEVFGVLDEDERATLVDLLTRVTAAADARRLGLGTGQDATTADARTAPEVRA